MSLLYFADQVRLIDFLMPHPNAYGPYNACAPAPVRNTVFTQSIAAAVHRPTFLVLPEMALRVGFGEMATILTSSQHALPAKLQQAGFSFQFTELLTALNNLLKNAH